jgi:rubrerythrin
VGEPSGVQRLDTLINELIELDQTGGEIAPMDVARELGEIKSQLLVMPTVHRSADDLRHFRCEACGTITHGETSPASCKRCGGAKFLNVDIEG